MLSNSDVAALIKLTPEQKERHLAIRKEAEKLPSFKLIEWIKNGIELYLYHIQTTKGLLQHDDFIQKMIEETQTSDIFKLSLEQEFKIATIPLKFKGMKEHELINELMGVLESIDKLINGFILVTQYGGEKIKAGEYISHFEDETLI